MCTSVYVRIWVYGHIEARASVTARKLIELTVGQCLEW